jgi:uncharacterized protein with beta-barrel porin domain
LELPPNPSVAITNAGMSTDDSSLVNDVHINILRAIDSFAFYAGGKQTQHNMNEHQLTVA